VPGAAVEPDGGDGKPEKRDTDVASDPEPGRLSCSTIDQTMTGRRKFRADFNSHRDRRVPRDRDHHSGPITAPAQRKMVSEPSSILRRRLCAEWMLDMTRKIVEQFESPKQVQRAREKKLLFLQNGSQALASSAGELGAAEPKIARSASKGSGNPTRSAGGPHLHRGGKQPAGGRSGARSMAGPAHGCALVADHAVSSLADCLFLPSPANCKKNSSRSRRTGKAKNAILQG